MKRIVTWLAALWIAALLVRSSPAQPKLDRKTTIDVTAAAPRDVYGSLSRTLGCELVIAPEIQQPVTMYLENVTVRTALNALSENLGCRWTVDGNTLHVQLAGSAKPLPAGVVGGVPGYVKVGVPDGAVGGTRGAGVNAVDLRQRLDRKTPAGFHFDNMPLRTVMDALGKIAELEVRVEEPAAAQLVTIDLSDRTILTAFKDIQEKAGLKKGLVFALTVSGSGRKIALKIGPRKQDK
jgi:type II secretory pathway component GspD/PulD (secretin)